MSTEVLSWSSYRNRPARRPSSSSEAKTLKNRRESLVRLGAEADGETAMESVSSSTGSRARAVSLVVPATNKPAPSPARRFISAAPVVGSDSVSPQRTWNPAGKLSLIHLESEVDAPLHAFAVGAGLSGHRQQHADHGLAVARRKGDNRGQGQQCRCHCFRGFHGSTSSGRIRLGGHHTET